MLGETITVDYRGTINVLRVKKSPCQRNSIMRSRVLKKIYCMSADYV
jgi:hypothetical protein